MLPRLSPRSWIGAGIAVATATAVTLALAGATTPNNTSALSTPTSAPTTTASSSPTTPATPASSPTPTSSPAEASVAPGDVSPTVGAAATTTAHHQSAISVDTTASRVTHTLTAVKPATATPSSTRPPGGNSTGTPTGTPTITATVPPAVTPTITPADRAASFLVSQLTNGDHVEGPFGPDLGQTSDVALSLAATSGNAAPLDKVLAYLAGNASGYVHGDPSWGERADANYAGPTGKLALVALAGGKNPSSFGGFDLISELRTLMDGQGRFRDDSEFGDFSNPLGQSFDILALERGTVLGAPQVAIDSLATAQCSDGGFADAFPMTGSTCSSSPDSTGLALQALVASGADCQAAGALAWLNAHQGADGSFGSNAVDPSQPATGNVNSTAYAALGLNAAAQNTSQIVDYLTAVQNADGGLPIQPSSDKTTNLYATAQAVGALAGSSFLTIGPSPITPTAPACLK